MNKNKRKSKSKIPKYINNFCHWRESKKIEIDLLDKFVDPPPDYAIYVKFHPFPSINTP